MATSAGVRSMLPASSGGKLPHSFQDALKQGWSVVSDKSNQTINQKRREGKLTMQKRGCPSLLEVDYIGTLSGYRFSVPKFASE